MADAAGTAGPSRCPAAGRCAACSAPLVPVLLVPCRWFRAGGSALLVPVPLVSRRCFRAAGSRTAGFVPLVPRAASALLIPVLLVPCRWFPYCWFRAAGSAPLIPVPLVPCRWFRGAAPPVPRCRPRCCLLRCYHQRPMPSTQCCPVTERFWCLPGRCTTSLFSSPVGSGVLWRPTRTRQMGMDARCSAPVPSVPLGLAIHLRRFMCPAGWGRGSAVWAHRLG